MASCKVLFGFLLLALVYSAAEAKYAEERATTGSGDDIPQQCIDNSVTPVSCQNEHSENGLVPHPDDCELFYYCVNPDSPPVCRQCPAKLHFNPEKLVCDNPEDAGCQAGSGDGSADDSGDGSGGPN